MTMMSTMTMGYRIGISVIALTSLGTSFIPSAHFTFYQLHQQQQQQQQQQRNTRTESTDYNPGFTAAQVHFPFIFRRLQATLDECAASHSAPSPSPSPLPQLIPLEEFISKLDSYSSNIARTRKMFLVQRKHQHHHVSKSRPIQQGKEKEDNPNLHVVVPFINAVQSLYFTILNQQAVMHRSRTLLQGHNETLPISIHTRDQLASSLFNTLIQAIRGAADLGDYALILKLLLDAVIPFAVDFSNLHVIPSSSSTSSSSSSYTPANILHPRIFGEALVGLGQRTECSISKLKKVWTAFLSLTHPQVLLAEPSAQELTAMMVGLARRGKIRAALQLFYSHLDVTISSSNNNNNTMNPVNHHHQYNNKQEDPDIVDASTVRIQIQIDAYVINEVLRILADSIQDPYNNNNNNIPLGHIYKQDNQYENGKDDRNHNLEKDMDLESSTSTSSSSSSCCWQWRETEAILNWVECQHQATVTTHDQSNDINDRYKERPQVILNNNHVYSAALKVNERAQAFYGSQKHKGVQYAHNILERMKRAHISPDAITISTIMSTFDKGYKCKDAVELLESMEQVQHTTVPVHTVNHRTWSLPQPNVYSYSSAISSCARCGQYDQALSILERMRQASDDTGIVPNTWVYNAVLSACVREKESSIHGLKSLKPPTVDTALKILQYMEDDLLLKKRDTAPDVVTYNTLLALIGGMTNNLTFHVHPNTPVAVEIIDKGPRNSLTNFLIQAKDNKVEAIMRLWDEMKDKGLEKNEITYRNSLVACRSDPDGVARLFRRGLLDLKMTSTVHGEYPTRETQINKGDIGNLALSLCASSSELSSTAAVFETMKQENIKADSDSMFHLIQALYCSRRTDESIWLLNAMKGDSVANQLFEEKTRIDVLSSGIFTPMIEEQHYSSAIIGCLNTNEMFLAQKILSGMRIHGLVPVDGNLEKIILAYCKMSIDAASKEFADARIENSNREDRYTMLKPSQQTSEARATAALNMMKTLASPTVEVRVAVARALCSSGMHSSARQIVRSLHDSAMEAINEKALLRIPVNKVNIDLFREVPKLHKSLLKLCARSGNITAALWYADDIQHLSSELNRGSAAIKPSIMLEDTYLSAENLPFGVNVSIGMKGEDWKLVTVAASKAAQWKICVGTLQFLRPYIEETNPKNIILQHARTEPIDISTKRMLESQYESYSRALTASVLAFEISGQYAWAVRAINDWIEWSGRRPPKEAVFSLCRILAARSQGVHVVALIHQILQIPIFLSRTSNKIDFDSSYEFAIYSQAIVALYQNGLYDHADELYAAAVAGRFLPFALLQKEANDKCYRLDLHGMNSAIAHSAVRVSLQHLIQTSAAKPITDDLLIVTGRGRGSTRWLRPILRPEVQRMLIEEFYPPISTVSMPGNMGALKVSAADVNEWMNHQQQQKGVRLLTVAEILKSFTSGSLLRRALSRLKD